jgi:tRNA-dihydrouridine synthase 3
VTVKIRLGWNAQSRNYLELARAAVDAGAAAITVHGRTREARYRHEADWDAIGEVAAAVPVPVIGNGDLLWPHEIERRIRESGCAGVMIARGVLIKPWVFREYERGEYWDITAEERVAIYRRYVELASDHWAQGREGLDDYGRQRLHEFLRWHVGFWCRYARRRADGEWPSMQHREQMSDPRSPLEALLARTDDAALDYVTQQLLQNGDFADPPPASAPETESDLVEAG